MHYRITEINKFDFEDDNFELSPTEQQDVINDVQCLQRGKHQTLMI